MFGLQGLPELLLAPGDGTGDGGGGTAADQVAATVLASAAGAAPASTAVAPAHSAEVLKVLTELKIDPTIIPVEAGKTFYEARGELLKGKQSAEDKMREQQRVLDKLKLKEITGNPDAKLSDEAMGVINGVYERQTQTDLTVDALEKSGLITAQAAAFLRLGNAQAVNAALLGIGAGQSQPQDNKAQLEQMLADYLKDKGIGANVKPADTAGQGGDAPGLGANQDVICQDPTTNAFFQARRQRELAKRKTG